jgi:DNA polymerase
MKSSGQQSNYQDECRFCPLLAASRTQIVFPTPCPPGGLLAVGEAPGVDEDEIGEGFVGQAGRTLDTLLVRHGLERNRDYGVANIVRCRPEGNRKPYKWELVNCLPKLASFLMECGPKVLLLVGGVAADAFFGKGPLYWHIERSRQSAVLLAKNAHPMLQPAIRTLHHCLGCVYAIPMPHTSGLAWNRKTPDGRAWRDIGAEQVATAVRILVDRNAA